MTRSRADLGFADALAGFDPAEWSPDPAPEARTRPAPDMARQVAERTGFKSREAGQGAPLPAVAPASTTSVAAPPAPVSSAPVQPLAVDPQPPVRRRRTGRNAQFNLKARPETIGAFCAVADGNGWGLGETLEYAVALLQREYGPEG